jgi:hypothetical protein
MKLKILQTSSHFSLTFFSFELASFSLEEVAGVLQ